MPVREQIDEIRFYPLITGLIFLFMPLVFSCSRKGNVSIDENNTSAITNPASPGISSKEYKPVNAIMVLPKNPQPGKSFRILATGGKKIIKSHIVVSSPTGNLGSLESKTGNEIPSWRIDDFKANTSGRYKASLISDDIEICVLEFEVKSYTKSSETGVVWKTTRAWDSATEGIYSAWINALFYNSVEQASWSALHEVTRNQKQNFLYNYLSLDEDSRDGKSSLIMQPDCADNPFFLRAYFAWKLGLPFGYHICDRGYLGHNPGTGQWITNEISNQNGDAIQKFNSFLRRLKDGVHSGTGRTALDNEKSDYYPVPLTAGALRPGTVFTDPYGHTLILIGSVQQTKNSPGLLLAVDAQPDGTVGIKRFWKGNFLFTTTEVIGEPGFKAFRPITSNKGVPSAVPNKALTEEGGFIPFSLQQRKMSSIVFYHTMEKIINPKPLDPEAALLGLIQALHEQLLVRVTSVANGEAYFKSNQGLIIPMPSNAAGVFLAGGQWENFSTPNRDLRLLIAIDAVQGFPQMAANSPEDFSISSKDSPEEVRKKLQSILNQKATELSINYTRTNGSVQKLTIADILERKDAYEMAYNPNDGIEIRWGAPENSDERSTCKRHAPSNQVNSMNSVRMWFQKRLHPPT